jgi:hypothetical protein
MEFVIESAQVIKCLASVSCLFCAQHQLNSNYSSLYRHLRTSMDQIALKTPNPNCRLFFKIYLERDLAACVYKPDAPSPPRFLFGVVKQFCRFGIWSNTQQITPVDALNTTRSPHLLLHTVQYKLYVLTCTYSHREGVGGEFERR